MNIEVIYLSQILWIWRFVIFLFFLRAWSFCRLWFPKWRKFSVHILIPVDNSKLRSHVILHVTEWYPFILENIHHTIETLNIWCVSGKNIVLWTLIHHWLFTCHLQQFFSLWISNDDTGWLIVWIYLAPWCWMTIWMFIFVMVLSVWELT